MNTGSAPIRATPVVLQIYNTQLQRYDTVGTFPLIAMMVKSNFMLFLFQSNRPLLGIPVTSTTEWTLQNDTCCMYTDPQHRVYVLQFSSPAEARLFSAIACYQKLLSEKQPICIMKGNKGMIDPVNSFSVNFAAYDLNMKQITEPIRKEENFTISSFDDTPIKEVAGKGEYGSVFIVLFAPGVVAVVDVLDSNSLLPSLPPTSSNVSAKSKENTPKKEGKSRRSHKKGKHGRRESVSSSDVGNLSDNSVSSAPGKKKIEKEHDEEEEELPFDNQLADIRQTMENLYLKAKADIASLYRTQLLKSGIKPSEDDLVSSLQRLIKQNIERELVIEEKRELIDLLEKRDVDTSEVEKIRMQIGQTTTKLSLQKTTNRDLTSKINELKEKIEDAENKLVQTRVDAEAAKEIAQMNLQMKTEEKRADLRNRIEELKWQISQEEKQLTEAKNRLDFEKSEMQRIAKAHEEDYSEDYNLLKEQFEKASNEMKQTFIDGVTSMIVSAFEQEKEYPKNKALGAVRTALSVQNDDMFGGEYEEEESSDE